MNYTNKVIIAISLFIFIVLNLIMSKQNRFNKTVRSRVNLHQLLTISEAFEETGGSGDCSNTNYSMYTTYFNGPCEGEINYADIIYYQSTCQTGNTGECKNGAYRETHHYDVNCDFDFKSLSLISGYTQFCATDPR